MKYRLLLLVAVLFSWIGGNYAAVVPESTAVETANMLLSQRGGVLFKSGKAQVETIFQGNEPMYYIIRFEKGGWALISAEDTVDPLLGYSFDSEYVSEGQPEWIKGWLKEYTDQIKIARQTPALQRHYRWAGVLVSRATEDRIDPLITVAWNQDSPYNSLCPQMSGGPGGRSLRRLRGRSYGAGSDRSAVSVAGTGNENIDECRLFVGQFRQRTRL